MTVLIITGIDDVHADSVIPHLERSGCEVVRLNTDNLPENIEFVFDGPMWTGRLQIRDALRTLRIEQVDAVWYRKPVPIQARAANLSEPAQTFVAEEYENFLRSFYGLLDHAFWVSDYWAVPRASQKLPNLALAREIGLDVPATLVTNSKKDVREFGAAHSWRLIAKPFALSTFKLGDESSDSWDTFATAVDQTTFDLLEDSLPLAPTLLQEYVEKSFELRVTVIGSQIFCTAIDSQSHVNAKDDWRSVDAEELPHSNFELPKDISDKLIAFNRAHGLEFATHDLICNTDGGYVWLECNPNGQWLWCEHLTGQPISEAIAALLIDPSKHSLNLGRGLSSQMVAAYLPA